MVVINILGTEKVLIAFVGTKKKSLIGDRKQFKKRFIASANHAERKHKLFLSARLKCLCTNWELFISAHAGSEYLMAAGKRSEKRKTKRRKRMLRSLCVDVEGGGRWKMLMKRKGNLRKGLITFHSFLSPISAETETCVWFSKDSFETIQFEMIKSEGNGLKSFFITRRRALSFLSFERWIQISIFCQQLTIVMKETLIKNSCLTTNEPWSYEKKFVPNVKNSSWREFLWKAFSLHQQNRN